jgi:hypothetical protein
MKMFLSISTGDNMMDAAHAGFPNRDQTGMQFSTYDQDNDLTNTSHCADKYCGGWWFNACFIAFLNGPWAPEQWVWPWYPTVTSGSNVKETTMMIKTY